MSKIRRMLDKRASGCSIEPKKHRQWVRYNGKTYRLSKGSTVEKTPRFKKERLNKWSDIWK